MWYLKHKCGGIAFLYSEQPKVGDVALSSKAFHLDGRQMNFLEDPYCDCCGERLYIPDVKVENFAEIKNWNPR